MIKNSNFRNQVVEAYSFAELVEVQKRKGVLAQEYFEYKEIYARSMFDEVKLFKADADPKTMNELIEKFIEGQKAEWSEKVRDLPILAFNQALVVIFTYFEAFLGNAYEEILKANPQALMNVCDRKQQAILAELFLSPDYLDKESSSGKIFRVIRNQCLEAFEWDSFEKRFEKLDKVGLQRKKVFGFESMNSQVKTNHPDAKAKLEKLRLWRNAVVHRGESPIRTIHALSEAMTFLGDLVTSVSFQAMRDLGIDNEDRQFLGKAMDLAELQKKKDDSK